MSKGPAIILLTLAAAVIAACSADESNDYSTQIARIEQYLDKELAKDTTVYWVKNEGSFRMTRKNGFGEALKRGDTLLFTYTGYNFSSYDIRDANIFVTNDSTVKWALTDSSLVKNAPARAALGEDSLLEGLTLGLEGIKAGETCEILFPSALGFGSKVIGTIPANCPLAYKVKAEKIIERKE